MTIRNYGSIRVFFRYTTIKEKFSPQQMKEMRHMFKPAKSLQLDVNQFAGDNRARAERENEYLRSLGNTLLYAEWKQDVGHSYVPDRRQVLGKLIAEDFQGEAILW